MLHHEILFTGIKIYDEALNEFSKEFNTLLNKMTGTKSDIGKIIKSAITKKIKKKLEIKYNKKLWIWTIQKSQGHNKNPIT